MKNVDMALIFCYNNYKFGGEKQPQGGIMASEKYKIRVSSYTYNVLQDDMIRFNFCDKNGKPNKNKFYNRLISGFYNNLLYRKENISNYLHTILSPYITDKNKINDLTDQINTKLNEIEYSDIHRNIIFLNYTYILQKIQW